MKKIFLLLLLVSGGIVDSGLAASKDAEATSNQPLIRTAMVVKLKLTDKSFSLQECITLMAAKYYLDNKLSNHSLTDIWSSPLVLYIGPNRQRVLFSSPPAYESLRRATVGKLIGPRQDTNFVGGVYSLQMKYPILGADDFEEVIFNYSTTNVPSEKEFRVEYQPLFQNEEYMPPVLFRAWAFVMEIDVAGRYTVEREGGQIIEKTAGVWITKIGSDEPIKLIFKRK